MKILFASDSFKGSLSSERICELLKEVTKDVFPTAITESIFIADGGEGTKDVLLHQMNGKNHVIMAKDPLFRPIQASYGVLSNDTAIIEMAAASGLPLLLAEERNPLKTTTYGTGMLINHALNSGMKHIMIGIGGSATNDGGMGALIALGVRFFDKDGEELFGCGENLERVEKIDCSNLHTRIGETKFTIICDVNNPLLGANGATYTFARQKGANSSMQERLENGMKHYVHQVKKVVKEDFSEQAGAGAAGGLGFALLSFLKADMKSGIDVIMDCVNFDEKLQGVDLVITGEGRMDWQSSYGKVPVGIGKRCKKNNIPVVAIVGGLLDGYEEIYNFGISSIVTTINNAMPLDEAILKSEQLYKDAAYRLLQSVKVGMEIQKKKSFNV